MYWDETPGKAYLCAPGRRKDRPGNTQVEIISAAEAELTPARMAENLIRIAKGIT
jgi:hypothetical protein